MGEGLLVDVLAWLRVDLERLLLLLLRDWSWILDQQGLQFIELSQERVVILLHGSWCSWRLQR